MKYIRLHVHLLVLLRVTGWRGLICCVECLVHFHLLPRSPSAHLRYIRLPVSRMPGWVTSLGRGLMRDAVRGKNKAGRSVETNQDVSGKNNINLTSLLANGLLHCSSVAVSPWPRRVSPAIPGFPLPLTPAVGQTPRPAEGRPLQQRASIFSYSKCAPGRHSSGISFRTELRRV